MTEDIMKETVEKPNEEKEGAYVAKTLTEEEKEALKNLPIPR